MTILFLGVKTDFFELLLISKPTIREKIQMSKLKYFSKSENKLLNRICVIQLGECLKPLAAWHRVKYVI